MIFFVILFYAIQQIFCALPITTETYYIIPGSVQTYYAPRRFVQNHQKLIYNRIIKYMTWINEEINKTEDNSLMQQYKTRCTFYYENKPFYNLYDFLISILDDYLTGDLFESFSEEIKSHVSNYFDQNKELINKEKPTSFYTMAELGQRLYYFHNEGLKPIYSSITDLTQFDAVKFKEILENQFFSQIFINNTSLSAEKGYKVNDVKTENIQRSFMGFFYPINDPENGLKFNSDLINSIQSFSKSETKVLNVFFDFHAEQFIYEYLSQSDGKEPNLKDCNNFLSEIYKEMKKIIGAGATKKSEKTENFQGSKVNLYFIRNNKKLAFRHLNFAMCHFSVKDDKMLEEICKNLNLIEEILPSYFCFIFMGFRNENVIFDVNVFIVKGQKFNKKILNKKCIRYDDDAINFNYVKDYTIYFDFTGKTGDMSGLLSNPIPNFDNKVFKFVIRDI